MDVPPIRRQSGAAFALASSFTRRTATGNSSNARPSREAARELETDDSEEHFDKIVKKIAKAPQPKRGGRQKIVT